MTPPRATSVWLRRAPGLALVAGATAAAFALARAPGGGLVGPLVLALLLGVAWRAAMRRPTPWAAPGTAFAAKTLLRIGIVLLGVRLDVRALAELGPWVLAGSAVGAVVAFASIELVGRAWGTPVALRRLVGIGTAICGASAIAAAWPLLRGAGGATATDEASEAARAATVSIAAISLLGTLGVLGFVAAEAAFDLPSPLLAAVAGATLQEVGQAVAAGAAVGGSDAELALLVKLSRVVLLAPALLALGWWSRREADAGSTSPASTTPIQPRPPLVPGFVVGFVALGALTSLGLLPPAIVGASALGGTLLTAAAMAAIGMGVDASALGRQGRLALALGAVGFAALTVAMAGWYVWRMG